MVFEMAKQVELSIRCIVKGYHKCPFEVNIGEKFYALKKRGQRGNAFKVTNDRGQLGHLQIELVSPLWPLHEKITVIVTGSPEDDPKGRWRHGGGKNVPVKVIIKLQESQAREVKRKLELSGLALMTRMMSQEKDD